MRLMPCLPLVVAGFLFCPLAALAGTVIDLSTDSLPTWHGGLPLEEIGWAAAACDLDGDGAREVVFTAIDANPLGRFHAGEIYVVWGGGARYPDTSFLEANTHHDLYVAGPAENSELGYGVAAGDVDGDGRQDLIIGELNGTGPGGEAGAGRAWLLWGDARAALGDTLDLAAPDARVLELVGVDAGDHAGYNVDLVDWNGDGKADIVVSAPYAGGPGNARPDCGEVRVVYGRPRALLGASLDLGAQSDVLIYGPAVNAEAGLSVGGGDVDGNGVQDLLIGAPRAAGFSGQFEAGQVSVLFGPGPATGSQVDLAAQSGMRFYGEIIGNRLGGVVPSPFQQRSVAGADWDGDGYDDVVMGAIQADPLGTSDAGIVYVYYGGPRAWLPAQVDLGDEVAVALRGPEAGAWLGLWVGADDFDLDARDDLVVAAPRAEGPGGRARCGSVWVLKGRPRAQIPMVWELATDFDLRFIGADAEDHLGIYASAGDVDGDYSPDLILAACEAAGPGNSIPGTGECYVHYMPALPAAVEVGPPRFALRLAGRHPARGPLALALDLPRRGPVAVEALDLAGRRVATLWEGMLEAGSHPLTWAPAASGGARPGVYFIVARGPLGRASARVVVLEQP